MLRIQILNDETGEVIPVGKVGEFCASIVDAAGKVFVKAMVQEMGSVALVMTKKGFATKADQAFDRIEADMRKKTSGLVDSIVQGARDAANTRNR
jgi:hypothetical protein